MSGNQVKEWAGRIRQAAVTLLMVAVVARLVWTLLAPVVPVLVSLIVVIVVLGVAIFGWRSK
jgi:hypothetical protein